MSVSGYRVRRGDRVIGPFTWEQIVESLQAGRLQPSDEVAPPGTDAWVALGSYMASLQTPSQSIPPASASASVSAAPAPSPPASVSEEVRKLVANTEKLLAHRGHTLNSVVPDPLSPDDGFDIESVFRLLPDEAKQMTQIPKGLPSIGPATLSLLNSNGIATAYDILHRHHVPSINGVGSARWSVLTQWAREQDADCDRLAASYLAWLIRNCVHQPLFVCVSQFAEAAPLDMLWLARRALEYAARTGFSAEAVG